MEYKGEHPEQFYYLCKHILDNEYDYNYYVYSGNSDNRLQFYIDVVEMTTTKAQEILEKISTKIESKIPREWKSLPSLNLPDEYNIAKLPYGKLAL